MARLREERNPRKALPWYSGLTGRPSGAAGPVRAALAAFDGPSGPGRWAASALRGP